MEIVKIDGREKIIGAAGVCVVFGNIEGFTKTEARVGASRGVGEGGLAGRCWKEGSSCGLVRNGTRVAGNSECAKLAGDPKWHVWLPNARLSPTMYIHRYVCYHVCTYLFDECSRGRGPSGALCSLTDCLRPRKLDLLSAGGRGLDVTDEALVFRRPSALFPVLGNFRRTCPSICIISHIVPAGQLHRRGSPPSHRPTATYLLNHSNLPQHHFWERAKHSPLFGTGQTSLVARPSRPTN